MSEPKLSILAIGTELTTGQIINRNASWISERLYAKGLRTQAHLTVPDDRALILRALDFCRENSDVIFVTGGLGPTSDDFTRDVIAEWTKKPLQWDEDSWAWIKDRLSSRGVEAKEIQKQQCYFPQGAKILKNTQGTANAFRVEQPGLQIIVLPGPPREIQAVWEDHVDQWLGESFPKLDPWITRSWDTIGQPESAMAEITENILQKTDFEKGYRVHLPFVEIKMSFPRSQEKQALPYVENLTKALAPYTALRDSQTAAQNLAKSLPIFQRLIINDEVSGGYLWKQLQEPLLKKWRGSEMIWSNLGIPSEFSPQDLVLNLVVEDSNTARAEIFYKNQVRRMPIQSPYKLNQLMQERRVQYFAEMALLFWSRELSG